MKYVILLVILQICSVIPQEIVFPTTSTGHASGHCFTTAGEKGKCVELRSCAKVIKDFLQGVWPTNCGFNQKMPLVCCPLLKNPFPTSRLTKADEIPVPESTIDIYCGYRGYIEYDPEANLTKEEPIFRRSARAADFFVPPPFVTQEPKFNFTTPYPVYVQIEGGVHAFRNSWPWMALLGRRKGLGEDFFCSAVIINENYLLTAAHCVLGLKHFFVRVGEHDYSPDIGQNLYETIEDVEVDKVIFHPFYDFNEGYHDIALIKLATSLLLRGEVRAICLPWGSLIHENLIGENCIVTGWGKEGFDGLPSTILQEVNVTIFHPSTCEKSYSTLRDFNEKFPQGMSRENILCAGDIAGGKDACEGDSGGPIMHHDVERDSYSLAGIISIGFGCGKKEFPGLYAPLRHYPTLQWIKNTAF